MTSLFVSQSTITFVKRSVASFMLAWLIMGSPIAVLAQESVDAAGNQTGAGEQTGTDVATGTAAAETGAQECTGAGCGQGADQGLNQGTAQGVNQGGGTLVDPTNPASETTAPLQGAGQGTSQGAAQGTSNGVTAENTGTGADSTNSTNASAANNATTNATNSATNTTNAAATATSGGNTQNQNSASIGVTSGNAGIGVTQVINDNSTTIGGTAGLNVTGYEGDHQGNLNLDFGATTAGLLNNFLNGGSIRAINDTTGSNSDNDAAVHTQTEELNEVQNDGRIDNLLDLVAITGQNEASKNSGDGSIVTGDADVAATLINLLNTTVVNGNLWVSVADVFGDLIGDITLPDFSALASFFGGGTQVDATNSNTGSDSDNHIAVEIDETETTAITNDADINSTVNATAITGQNEALSNTGGAEVTTGDAHVSAANVSLANTTIEGGNWGLVIVNALNGWLGFLVGDNGQVQALSQDETLRHVEAQNNNTGSNSDNTIAIHDESDRTTLVDNDAVINNEVNATAITGQNETNKNTGAANIATGDANIQATTVNIANTTVKDGSLFIAVVNVFGDWFGDLLYGGSSLTAAAAAQSQLAVNADNTSTGADSNNTIAIDYNRSHETNIDNEADVTTALNATVDTGNNRANKNTGGAKVDTGNGLLALHSRTLANITGIAGSGGVNVEIDGANDTTGANSENTISARVNNDRIIAVNNDANVSTLIGSANTPALVNTGGNTADQNTLGALIMTGDASAEVAIQNLVNQVVVALMGQGITVDADFANTLTGALSGNHNNLTAEQQTVLDIVNSGLVNNLINLLLLTGNNSTNENTGPVAIFTGAVCVDASVDNQVNKVAGATNDPAVLVTADMANTTTGFTSDNTNAVTAGAQLASTTHNSGAVTNEATITGQTGNNAMNDNTGGGTASGSAHDCNKIAQAPEVSPTPVPVGGVGGPEAGKGGEGEEGQPESAQKEDKAPRVAGAINGRGGEGEVNPGRVKNILRRFPVAGGFSDAKLFAGHAKSLWPLYLAVSLGILATAYFTDSRRKVSR